MARRMRGGVRLVRLWGVVWRRNIDDGAGAVIRSPLCFTELRSWAPTGSTLSEKVLRLRPGLEAWPGWSTSRC